MLEQHDGVGSGGRELAAEPRIRERAQLLDGLQRADVAEGLRRGDLRLPGARLEDPPQLRLRALAAEAAESDGDRDLLLRRPAALPDDARIELRLAQARERL